MNSSCCSLKLNHCRDVKRRVLNFIATFLAPYPTNNFHYPIGTDSDVKYIAKMLRNQTKIMPNHDIQPLSTAVKHRHITLPFMYVAMNWVIIGSGNGLAPVRCQAIIWINAD